ncbi:pyridoxal-phosphate dependent enzyme, partial [Methanoregula sp. PtaU1.Bin006]
MEQESLKRKNAAPLLQYRRAAPAETTAAPHGVTGSRDTGNEKKPACTPIPKFHIRCVGGGEFIDDPSVMNCPQGHDSLLRAEYSCRRLVLSPYSGIFRYLCWLPVTQPLVPSGGPVTLGGTALGRELGLANLSISFSGYFPECGADLTTGSFKELEALATLQRLRETGGKIPVVASAGNTGRAFAGIAARCGMPVVIV